MHTDKRHDNYFPCRRKICIWEHVWSWIIQRILFNEEEHDKKASGGIKIE